jgi:hypothetical protein
MRAKYIYEAMEDILKPKTKKDFENLSTEKLLDSIMLNPIQKDNIIVINVLLDILSERLKCSKEEILKKQIYVLDFVEELDKIKGKDGFPWAAYPDYVYEELQSNIKLLNMLKKFMDDGLTPIESALKMKTYFKKGMRY